MELSPSSSSNWIVEGFLEKGKHFRNLRYFFLSEKGKLCYGDAPTQPVKQTLYITDSSGVTFDDSKRVFRLTQVLPSDLSKEYHLSAPTAGEYGKWKSALRRVLSMTASATAQREYDRAVLQFLDKIREAFTMALSILVTDDASIISGGTFEQPRRDENNTLPLIGRPSTGPNEKMMWLQQVTKLSGVSATPEWVMSVLNSKVDPRLKRELVSFDDALAVQNVVTVEQGKVMSSIIVRFLSLAIQSAKGKSPTSEKDEAVESLFDLSLPTGTLISEACSAFQLERERLAQPRLLSMWRKSLQGEGCLVRSDAAVALPPPLSVSTLTQFLTSPQWIVPNLIVDVLHDAAVAFLSRQANQKFSTEPGAGMCGLQNLGNTCFLNAALQCLLHTPQVKRFLLMKKLQPPADSTNPQAKQNKAGGEQRLTGQLVALANKMWTKVHAAVDPSLIRAEFDRVTFGRFTEEEEHDAHEALLALIDGLHDELNVPGLSQQQQAYQALPDQLGPSVPTEDVLASIWWEQHLQRNKSIMQSLFHGQIRQTITCLECSSVSYCCDPFQFLMLSFPTKGRKDRERVDTEDDSSATEGADPVALPQRSSAESDDVNLEVLVASYFAPEVLKESVRCDKCKRVQPCRKRVVMTRSPPYLIICLKRFRSNKYGQLVAKNNAAVSIPHELDISPFTARSVGGGAGLSTAAHPRTFSAQSSTDSDAAGEMTDPFALPPGPHSYQLYAAVHHSGTLSSGHYYATCLCRGKWFLFNDSSITPLQPGWEDEASRTSYILLYKQRR